MWNQMDLPHAFNEFFFMSHELPTGDLSTRHMSRCFLCAKKFLAHARPPFPLKPNPKPGFDQQCILVLSQRCVCMMAENQHVFTQIFRFFFWNLFFCWIFWHVQHFFKNILVFVAIFPESSGNKMSTFFINAFFSLATRFFLILLVVAVAIFLEVRWKKSKKTTTQTLFFLGGRCLNRTQRQGEQIVNCKNTCLGG